MNESKFVKVVLFISGIIGISIGGALLIDPIGFESSSGIILGGDINLLSELRAQGGTLLTAGILIILGAFVSSLTYTSVIISGLFYFSYGISRVMGMAIDGIPHDILVLATIAEIVIGLLSIYIFIKFRKREFRVNN